MKYLKNCLTTKSTGNGLKNQQRLCLVHELFKLKFDREKSFKCRSCQYKKTPFLLQKSFPECADFETREKENKLSGRRGL